MRFLATFLCVVFAPGCGPAAAGGTFYDIGAVLRADTSTSGWGWVIDEDSFASDLATKVPTQQSVKAYVDANVGSGPTITTDSTLAQCEALTCAVGDLCYPSNAYAQHLQLVCRSAATWTYLVPGMGQVVIPTQMTSSTGWSWVNQGSATVGHGAVMSMYSPASAALDQHVYVRTAPATPWTLTAIIDQKGGTTRLFGLYLRESGTGELYRFGTSLVGSEGLSVRHDTSATVSSTNPFVSLYDVNGNDGPIKLQIEDNGTTLYFRVIALRSGTVNELYSVARTTHMAAGPDQLGIGIATTGSPAYLDVLSWDLE